MIRATARAKINLALHVLGRRGDGCHELDSIVAFADLGDRLAFADLPDGELRLDLSGPFEAGLPVDAGNIVIKAAQRLGGGARGALIRLEKNLPVAAGIGGGSADAAATLIGLNRLWGLGLAPQALAAIGLELGADVPVCLFSGACRMRGAGERIEPIAGFGSLHAVLVNPLLPLATAAVFKALNLAPGAAGGEALVMSFDLSGCRNDLTAPAVRLVPQIADVLAALRRQADVITARMSGSGATCFAIFPDAGTAAAAAASLDRTHPGWWVRACALG